MATIEDLYKAYGVLADATDSAGEVIIYNKLSCLFMHTKK